jgi:hypothetical protein
MVYSAWLICYPDWMEMESYVVAFALSFDYGACALGAHLVLRQLLLLEDFEVVDACGESWPFCTETVAWLVTWETA